MENESHIAPQYLKEQPRPLFRHCRWVCGRPRSANSEDLRKVKMIVSKARWGHLLSWITKMSPFQLPNGNKLRDLKNGFGENRQEFVHRIRRLISVTWPRRSISTNRLGCDSTHHTKVWHRLTYVLSGFLRNWIISTHANSFIHQFNPNGFPRKLFESTHDSSETLTILNRWWWLGLKDDPESTVILPWVVRMSEIGLTFAYSVIFSKINS